MELVHYGETGGFATITLDSPHNRNALSVQLLDELTESLTRAEDPAVRAIVLTHSGNTFCSGADLSSPAGADPQQVMKATTGKLAALLRTLVAHPKPVVAKVTGHVRGGGLGLLAACDIAVAGPAATFALTEVRVGVAAAVISLTVLPRLHPRAASRYLLTGEKFGTEAAAAIGLITIATSDPAATVTGILSQFAQASPQGLAESKAILARDLLERFDRDAAEMAELSARLFTSAEAREGITAFLQRRPASWVLSAPA